MKNKFYDIFKNPPMLVTERLVLKKICIHDLNDVYEYRSDPEVSRYLLWHPDANPGITKDYLYYIEDLYRKGRFYDYGIFLKSTEKMIGTVGFTTVDLKSKTAVVGYVLNSNYWGQGYTHEALTRLCEFAFKVLNFEKLEARIASKNVRSQALIKKCGFDFSRAEITPILFRDGWDDIFVYSKKKTVICHN